MIDISLLRILKTREGYEKIYSAIPIKALEQKTQALIKDINRYYMTFTEHTEIDYVLYRDLFFNTWHKTLTEEQVSFYDKILTHAEQPSDPVAQSVIINALIELNLATEISHKLEEYNEGQEINLVADLLTLVENANKSRERKDVAQFIEINPDVLLAAEENNEGIHYRCEPLEASLKPMQFGEDFLVVAARPNQGKTTLLLGEATHACSQIDDRPVLWLNNEGMGERIVKRGMQVALGATISEMIEMNKQGTLIDNYEKALGCEHTRFRVVNIHDMWNWEVEELIEAHNPKMVVFDMIDHIKFAGLSLAGGSRTDQILEEMYKWARNLGVKHNLIPMATSQISVDGEGIPYPDKSMLKDSKTGKQGAADTILMLGHSNDPALINARFISTPKTKSKKEGTGLPRQEMHFDIDRARFIMPTGGL